MNVKEIEITENEYDDMLDEIYGDVQIANLTYSTSTALKRTDPIAYRVGMGDWESENQKYECGNCGEVYEDKDEAEECCEEICETAKCPDDISYCEECKFYRGDDDE